MRTKTEESAESAIAASFPQVDNPAEQNYNTLKNRISKGGAHMANEMGKRYRCAKCGTELIVTRAGTGKLVCCKQPMEKKT